MLGRINSKLSFPVFDPRLTKKPLFAYTWATKRKTCAITFTFSNLATHE